MNASLRWAIVIAALVPDAAWSDAKAGVPGYTIVQLDAFKAGKRSAAGHAAIAKLSDAEIDAIGHALRRLE